VKWRYCIIRTRISSSAMAHGCCRWSASCPLAWARSLPTSCAQGAGPFGAGAWCVRGSRFPWRKSSGFKPLGDFSGETGFFRSMQVCFFGPRPVFSNSSRFFGPDPPVFSNLSRFFGPAADFFKLQIFFRRFFKPVPQRFLLRGNFYVSKNAKKRIHGAHLRRSLLPDHCRARPARRAPTLSH
jgi:hypothetical protein